jgi:hypothetical protein
VYTRVYTTIHHQPIEGLRGAFGWSSPGGWVVGHNDRVHDDPSQPSEAATADAEVRMLTTSVVYADQWLTFRRDETERRDGSRGTYAYVEKRNFALIIPADRRVPPGRGVPLPARAARLVVPAGRLPARRVGDGR